MAVLLLYENEFFKLTVWASKIIQISKRASSLPLLLSNHLLLLLASHTCFYITLGPYLLAPLSTPVTHSFSQIDTMALKSTPPKIYIITYHWLGSSLLNNIFPSILPHQFPYYRQSLWFNQPDTLAFLSTSPTFRGVSSLYKLHL